jgi:hypothetical protein
VSADVGANPLLDGPGFLSIAMTHPNFRAIGSISGRIADTAWAVVDPQRHPLFVWARASRLPGSYARSAQALDAVVVTNGPMMGKRLPGGRKVTRSWLPVEFALRGAIGASAGVLAGSRRRTPGPDGLIGAAVGVAIAAARSFTRWMPCGTVRGAGVDDRRNFDSEGARHAWFGRRPGTGFDAYGIGDGDLPADVVEGMGGLILLVRDYLVVGRVPGEPGYRRDFAELGRKRGVVAWGLLPAAGGSDTGVLVVLGGRGLDAVTAADALVSMGARDAVATDQSGSVLMGSRHTWLLRRPNLLRQSMQNYGLCCH